MRRLLIRGGTLVDGTGAAARRADIVIEAGRIAAILPPGAPTTSRSDNLPQDQLLDASDQVICPGFIDIHSHGELIHTLPHAEQRELMTGRLGQGITTEIVGNCGTGIFPCTMAASKAVKAVASWMTPARPDGSGREEWPWSDLSTYLGHLESNGILVNVGALQPHGPLRIEAAGLERELPGPDGADGMKIMARRLDEALDAGAFGMSTGLIYPPGIYTHTDEIISLARRLAQAAPSAFLASHIRGSSEMLLPAVAELLEVGRAAGVRVQHSHSEAVGRDHWPKLEKVLEMEEGSRRSGQEVAFDMFPYTAAATTMLAIYPPWSLTGGVHRLLERLADPGTREEIRVAIETTTPSWPPWTPAGWPHNLVAAVGWDQITIGSVASVMNRPHEGMSLADLGRARSRSPFDAISDLMIEEHGDVSQIIHGISGDEAHEEGIDALLTHPAGAVCTDANDFGRGRPHPAAWGTFPRVLARYVRERHLLTLEAAIRKMTGYPASLLGLKDRGVIRRGVWADLTIFDPETIGSQATFAAPRTAPAGIAAVLVNGTIAVLHGQMVAASIPSGQVLRRLD